MCFIMLHVFCVVLCSYVLCCVVFLCVVSFCFVSKCVVLCYFVFYYVCWFVNGILLYDVLYIFSIIIVVIYVVLVCSLGSYSRYIESRENRYKKKPCWCHDKTTYKDYKRLFICELDLLIELFKIYLSQFMGTKSIWSFYVRSNMRIHVVLC